MRLGLWRNGFAIALAVTLAGCNTLDRPQVIERDSEGDEVVALPGGGALILRALRRNADTSTLEGWCFPRARHFAGTVAVRCSDIASQTR